MNDYPRYLPFLNGTYSTAPGLKPAATENEQIFQIDGHYRSYLRNKIDCRQENIHKYYLESELSEATIQAVNRYTVAKLIENHPDKFTHRNNVLSNALTGERIEIDKDWLNCTNQQYRSLFDALCSQVQEDLAVFQLSRYSDHLAAIHLCAPNHWSPGEKIGRPFDEIHQPVAGMEQTIKHYRKILESIVYKAGPFTRFAWGVGTDNRLNHHPIAPPGNDPETWKGRSLSDGDSAVFVRVERQNLVGLPHVNAFLFTIRTYFYNVETLSPDEKLRLWQAVQSMSQESLRYKGLADWKQQLEKKLFG